MSTIYQIIKNSVDQLESATQLIEKLLNEANAKIAELEDWKAQQLLVESEWDAQALAKLLGAKPGQSCRRVINERVPELIAELEGLKAAAVPLCIGRPIITILAKEGQWMSETGQGVIAADELFRNNPYDVIDKVIDDNNRLREALQWASNEARGRLPDWFHDIIKTPAPHVNHPKPPECAQ